MGTRPYVTANNAHSTLASAVDSTTTTFTVADASLFPSETSTNYYDWVLSVENEIVEVTAVSGNTFTVVRGVDGTIAASHAQNTPVYNRLTSGTHDKLRSCIVGLHYFPFKNPVFLRSTANIATLSGPQTVDGIVTSNHDMVLLTAQTTASENGIYKTQGGTTAWVKLTTGKDTDIYFGYVGVYTIVYVTGGTHAGTTWVCSDMNTWTQFAPKGYGLTTGHFLKATGAGTMAFGAHGLTASDVAAAPDTHVGAGGTAHSAATISVNGFMPSTDKAKLDGATSLATISTLMMRAADGSARVEMPSSEVPSTIQNRGALVDYAAPISHAATGTTYGVASASNYGHTKLKQSVASADTTPTTAASENAVSEEAIQKHLFASAAIRNTSNITLADATWTALTMNSERWGQANTGAVYYSSTKNGIIITEPGIYLVCIMGRFTANDTGRRAINAQYYTTATDASVGNVCEVSSMNAGAVEDTFLNGSSIWEFDGTTYVRLRAYQNSGGDLALKATQFISPELRIVRVGMAPGVQGV